MQTLKHIVLDLRDSYNFDVDALFGIPYELDVMRNKNIIETIEISVKALYRLRVHWLRGGYDWVFDPDWGRLDEVLTAPGWFSLKRVSLTMKIHMCKVPELDVTLRNLTMRQFPRHSLLSSSNSLSFDFKATH